MLKNYICPKEVNDLKFEKTTSTLCELFDEKSWKFSKSFKWEILTKTPDENEIDFVNRINENIERSDLRSISNDHFKCLFFLYDLRKSLYAGIHASILYMVEQNHDIILKNLGDKCRRMDTVLNDTVMI